MRSKIWPLGMAALSLAALTYPANGQSVSGTITGFVTDPSGGVIAGAHVTVTSDNTRSVRAIETNENGAFTVATLPPGGYSLKVEARGFSIYQRTGLALSADERLSAGRIELHLGAATETISVTETTAPVQTASGEKSALLTSDQLDAISVRGRDYTSMLKLLPGVNWQADQDSLGTAFGSPTTSIVGAPIAFNQVNLDGVLSNDLGNPWIFGSPVSTDAIQEVKVLLSAYQAEYSGNGGPVVNVVTKSGTKDFHGTGYWFVRNEDFNANDFFSNSSGIARPLYRYNTLGGTLGGPIFIPGRFNRLRNKLFGFYAGENWTIKIPQPVQRVTVPTALERAGNFSQSVDVNGKIIVIKDPQNNGVAFPGNVIPGSRLNSSGLALMNILPLPNATDRAVTLGNYNYQFQESLDDPKHENLFKVDYLPTAADRISLKGQLWVAQQYGYNVSSPAAPWGLVRQCYCFNDKALSLSYTHIFSSNVILEFNAGVRHSREKWLVDGGQDQLNRVLRSATGFTAGQWYPQSNAGGIIPQVTWSGITNPANITYNVRFLTGAATTVQNYNGSLTVVHGPHTFKLGIADTAIRYYQGEQGIFGGSFTFANSANNPFNSGYAYSNAALGNFDSYTESNARYGVNLRQPILEWFVQDSWKVTPRLTIDAGVRFSWHTFQTPVYAGQQALLALGRYDASQTPVLYRPAIGPTGARVGQDPTTGAYVSGALIGAFVPGTGNTAVGGVLSGDASYPNGWINTPPIVTAPRLGIAWDPFGDGKTAVRAAAGILYNLWWSEWSATAQNPPAQYTPVAYYGNLNTFLQSSGVLFPSTTKSFDVNLKTPSVYNLTFGVQRDLGFHTVLDVSYVSTLGRDLNWNQNLNTLPYGTRFLRQNQDPTAAGKPLPDAFLVPRPGYSTITYYSNAGSSNYNGLLVSANRRWTHGFQLGVAWTYSKSMTYANPPLYQPRRTWSYGLASTDQTHNVSINYTWAIPAASKLWANPIVHHVLDNWQLSGITTVASGLPSGISFTTTDGADLTGGGDGQRVNVVGNSHLPPSQQNLLHWFNTSAFARPGLNDPGNAGIEVIRLPGIYTWDASLVKKIPLKKEGRALTVRWEAYNAFNHTQFSAVNTTARFDPSGNQVNAQFGQVTSTRLSRVMQGSLRFSF